MNWSTSSCLRRMTRPNRNAAISPWSMKRYKVRWVIPRYLAASAVDSHWISLVLTGASLRHLSPNFDTSRGVLRRTGVRISAVTSSPAREDPAAGAPGLPGTRTAGRRPALPNGRAVLGGLLVATAAIGTFAAWS